MKLEKIKSYIFFHKRTIIASVIIISVVSILFLPNVTRFVKASFGSPGDTSLIHACKDNRGRLIQVDAGSNCNGGETLVTWLKDVDAGSGLSITRSSSGATLSLSNDNTDGWTSAGETWAYVSASTFTVSGDKAVKYSKGTRLKFTQTTAKYAVVVGSSYSAPNTTVTIAVNNDYVIADAAISANYYSYQQNPQGYPTWFTYSPSWSGTSGSAGTFAATNTGAKFKIDGSACTFFINNLITNKGSWSGEVLVTLPVANASAAQVSFAGWIAANGTNPATASKGYPGNHSNNDKLAFNVAVDTNTLNWSVVANNDRAVASGTYPF